MNKIALLVITAVAGLALTACGAASPLPQSTDPVAVAVEGNDTSSASTCDVVREAFLTGTVKEQTAALKKLKADKSADATAREYAGYWLGRDKGDPTLQEMDQTLIVSACSL